MAEPFSSTPPATRSRAVRAWLQALPFLLPNLLGFLVFTFLPILACFGLSLTSYDLAPVANLRDLSEHVRFVGLQNFFHLLGWHRDGGQLVANDTEFWRYLGNTLFLMLGIPLSIAGSLLLALLLNQRLRGITLFRTIYFLPTVSSAVAIVIVWKWIFHQQPNEVGLLNSFLMSVGLAHPPDWLGSMGWAKPAFIIMALWAAIGGYNCVLYLAGLQGIPQELYEAAEMDGASWWQKTTSITWPLLAPTTFFILVMSLIAGFQGHFVAIHILTRGGPAGATTNLLYYIYQSAFDHQKMGYACTLAMVLFAIIFVCTALNWKYGRQATEISL